jgi:hypothetical protein
VIGTDSAIPENLDWVRILVQWLLFTGELLIVAHQRSGSVLTDAITLLAAGTVGCVNPN